MVVSQSGCNRLSRSVCNLQECKTILGFSRGRGEDSGGVVVLMVLAAAVSLQISRFQLLDRNAFLQFVTWNTTC